MGAGRGADARVRRRPLVGAQIRRLRTDRGLTLAQVGERAALNVGYLSQLENDKASPSLETLAALADAIEVPITWLLVGAAPPPRVMRREDRRFQVEPDGSRLEEVDGGFARGLRVIEGVLMPGASASDMVDVGEEHHLVLEGRIRLRQGEFVADLEPGDYLVWDGCFPHSVENIADVPSRVLIMTPGPTGIPIDTGRQGQADGDA